MFKMIVIWVLLSVALGAGIAGWRKLTGMEQWQLTRLFAYATLCSLVAVIGLSFLVLLF